MVAYTHLFFLGFMTITVLGSLSYCLPLIVSGSRAKGMKKRQAALQAGEEIIGRWRVVHLTLLSLGAIGLSLVAALVWQFPLSSRAVQMAGWVSGVFLVIGLSAFVVRVSILLGHRPAD